MSNHYPISNRKKAFYIKIGQASKIQWYKFNSEVNRGDKILLKILNSHGNKEILKQIHEGQKKKHTHFSAITVENKTNSNH